MDLFVSELNEWIEPYVLGSTFPVLSVGIESGYSFVWLANESPYYITKR